MLHPQYTFISLGRLLAVISPAIQDSGDVATTFQVLQKKKNTSIWHSVLNLEGDNDKICQNIIFINTSSTIEKGRQLMLVDKCVFVHACG